MSAKWKEIDAEQLTEAPPSTCRYCGGPIYWELLPDGKKQPVDATDFGRHNCGKHGTENRPKKEAEMPTDKGKCKHGEFILTEGCPQCIEEAKLVRETGVDKAEEAARDIERLAMNQQGQLELAAIEEESKISPQALPSQAYDEYFTPPELGTRQPYRLANGGVVPGVTTVLKVLSNGEGLNYWCWDLGRQGLDYREVRDAAGRVGTIAHRLIAAHLRGEAPNYQPLACLPDEAEKAEKCFLKYLAWEKENPLVPVIIETPFVSEEFKYGGTPDLLAEIDGDFILLDFKTGGGIYESYFTQLAAYWNLLKEQKWPIADARVVRISPDDSEVEVAIALDLDREWQIFQHALGIYTLRGGAQWQQ
jgi:hypothetical protein